MKIVKPYKDNSIEFTSLNQPYMKNSIFLAGPCPRNDYEDDWRDELKYISPKKYEYVLRHEVINPNGENYNKNLFYAFGHIHGRSQYKRNGIDVGIDANNYIPIDSDLLDWMHDAICKYVDENVFTDVCK